MASKKLIIAGGGIGGMTAALALRRAGVDVTVFERAPQFAEVGAGLSLWPNATRVLHSLGVLERVLARGDEVLQFDLQRPDGRPMATIPIPRYDTPAVCVHRADLHRALVESLPGICLEANRVIQSFDQRSGSVIGRFANGLAVEAEGIVGADGIHSVIRAQLHGAAAPVYRGYTIWRGLAANPGGLVRGHLCETWGAGQRFGIMPIGQGRVCWYATRNRPPAQPDAAEGRQAEVLKLFAGWHAPIPALIASTPAAEILKTDASDRPALRKWGRGNVTLLGDAAHPMTPNMGQGACMAIEDAAGLARMVAGVTDVAAGFRAYEALRQSRTAFIVQRARRIGVIGQWQNQMMVRGRNLVTRLVLTRLSRGQLDAVYGYRG